MGVGVACYQYDGGGEEVKGVNNEAITDCVDKSGCCSVEITGDSQLVVYNSITYMDLSFK